MEQKHEAIKQQAIQLLDQGDLSKVIDFLGEQLAYPNKVILLKSRLADLELDKKNDFLTREEYQTGMSKLRFGTTDFINNIGQPEEIYVEPFKINKELLLVLNFILSLLSFLALIYIIYLLKNN